MTDKTANNVIHYLYGLVCGRGHIYINEKKFIIEFAHKNAIITGIAHCHLCGYLATVRTNNNPNKDLFCKGCGAIVPKSSKKYMNKRILLSIL